MNLLDLIIVIPGLVVTSLYIIFIKVDSKLFRDGSNEFIQMMLMAPIAFVQIKVWNILFFGIDAYRDDSAPHKWWALLATVVFFLGVVKPIRRKVYPGEGIKGESDD